MSASPIRAVETRVARAGLMVAGLAVFAMMVAGASDAFGTFFGRPISGALEFAELLMVLVVFLSLPDAEANGRHITIDLISSRLPKALRRSLRTFAALLSAAFYGAMTWQACRLLADSWATREHTAGLVNFPVYWIKALFVTALVVVTVIAVANVFRALRGHFTQSHIEV